MNLGDTFGRLRDDFGRSGKRLKKNNRSEQANYLQVGLNRHENHPDDNFFEHREDNFGLLARRIFFAGENSCGTLPFVPNYYGGDAFAAFDQTWHKNSGLSARNLSCVPDYVHNGQLKRVDAQKY